VNISYEKLSKPTDEIIKHLDKWENDSKIVHFIRPSQNQAELDKHIEITHDLLVERTKHGHTYLIRLDGLLVGFMEFQIHPQHLYKKDVKSAWIGITIGEETVRGKGIGFNAMQFLEKLIAAEGLKRIELGVFEFNQKAIQLYKRLGYQEIARINDFTFWQGRKWQDIRMEKLLGD